jgi:hypothetical protein
MNKLVVAGAVVALGVAVGGASTASNSMPAGGVQGYGQVVSTGATVSAVTANPVPADASRLADVVFSTTTDITGKTATLTLKNASDVVGTPYPCDVTGTASPWTITCASTDNPLLNTFDTTGLTVV